MSTQQKSEYQRPPIAPECQPYWDALDAGHISIARCEQCRRWQHPPLERCRICAGPMRFEPITGTGTLYSFTVVEYPAAPGFEVPYMIALVELDEQPGVRLAAQLRGLDAHAVSVGEPVTLTVEDGPMGPIPVCTQSLKGA